jgi:hypothetical protein
MGTIADFSYVHGTLPDGRVVGITITAPEAYLIPWRRVKSVIVEWAKQEGVSAKSLGLLNEANWS